VIIDNEPDAEGGPFGIFDNVWGVALDNRYRSRTDAEEAVVTLTEAAARYYHRTPRRR
jgi:hypothetical protein